MKNLQLLIVFAIIISSCKKDDLKSEEPKVVQLEKIAPVSIDSKSHSETITLSRDVQKEGAAIILKDKSFWISNLKLNSNKLSFDVLENIYYDKGFRFDTILITVKDIIIGKITVVQARNRNSDKRCVWANLNANYINKTIAPNISSGLDLTKYVYNLGKTTNGVDNYKNYPAFAYCIDMNKDPANNMEWYLPSLAEMQDVQNRYNYHFFSLHVYWWTASDYGSNVFPFSETNGTTLFSKSEDYWIYAFRTGSKEQ